MKLGTFFLGLLAILTPLAAAWSKEDREIFRINDEIMAHEPSGTTFYDILGTSASASQDEISKAYRRKSVSLHPDKVKQQFTMARKKAQKDTGSKQPPKPPTQAELKAAIKDASERQARLSLIVGILRGPERDRYDHFLRNGFPVWKGTEYYYSRYRPGLGTVIGGLLLFCGGFTHYLSLWMSYYRQREFINRYIRFARETAWGRSAGPAIPGIDNAGFDSPAAPAAPGPADDDDDEAPAPKNRRQRRLQERDNRREAVKEGSRRGKKAVAGGQKEASAATATAAAADRPAAATTGPTGQKRRVVAENGKVLVVDSLRNVFLEEEDEDGNVAEYLLDIDEIVPPTIYDTLLLRIPTWAYRSAIGCLVPSRTPAPGSGGGKQEQAGGAKDAKLPQSRIEVMVAADTSEEEDSDAAAQHTPGSDSAEEFEMLDKSVDSIGRAKTSGLQAAGGKAGKRKGKK